MTDKWDSVSARVKYEADETLKNNKDGICVVTMHLIVDRDGIPILWTVDGKAIRIEPTKVARDVLLSLISG